METRDGDPVDVTVDGTAPGSYAGPGWLAIYEKAFAQLNGATTPSTLRVIPG